MKKLLLTLIALLLPSIGLRAAIKLPAIFSDHIVLQQQSDARIWGWATPGAKISLAPSWSKEKTTATAAADGRWEATLKTPAASFTPHTLTLSGDGSKTVLTDVLIGEVWFCSGQSNMEMPLNGFNCQPVEHSNETIAQAGRYKDKIHMLTVPKTAAATPQDTVSGSWNPCTPSVARWTSALAFFFAQELTDMLQVPVGIIVCAWGGSHVEGWLPQELLKKYKDIGAAQPEDPITYDWDKPLVMYNGMLHPLAGYTVRGILWNQGESNVGKHQAYPTLFKAMADHWRTLWQQPALPFYTVEIPPYSYGDPNGTQAALLREAQHEAARITPSCAIIGTNDLTDPSQVEDIHASRKREIGQRLAWAAAAREYGMESIEWQSPELKEATLNGRTATLTFSHAPNGLTPHESLEGFEVCGDDGHFFPATAREDMNTLAVTLTAPDSVSEIKAVRYNFKNFTVGRVHSLAGLPLIPFRTDRR